MITQNSVGKIKIHLTLFYYILSNDFKEQGLNGKVENKGQRNNDNRL